MLPLPGYRVIFPIFVVAVFYAIVCGVAGMSRTVGTHSVFFVMLFVACLACLLLQAYDFEWTRQYLKACRSCWPLCHTYHYKLNNTSKYVRLSKARLPLQS